MSEMIGSDGWGQQLCSILKGNWAAGPLGPLEVRLFSNNFVPGSGTGSGDLTEATFDGYAAIDPTPWSDPVIDPESNTYYLSPTVVVTFTQTGVVVTNTIYGFYLVDANGKLIMANRFDVPVEMDALGKQIMLAIKVFPPGLTGPDPYVL